ncbi:MAG: methylmalonyl-CoA mutase family protein [Bacteroidota bacterium]|jgi:methylmalonyl-CoA mutase
MELKEENLDISINQWKERLEKDLKGITFQQLSKTDSNGIEIFPFYNKENSIKQHQISFTHREWEICSQQISEEDHIQNKSALKHLNNGANSLIFNIHSGTNPKKLLDSIQAEYITTHFAYKEKNIEFIDGLNSYFKGINSNFSQINGSIIYDPISTYLRGYKEGFELRLNFWKKISESELINNSALSSFTTDAYIYQNSGCNTVNELAFTLAQVNEQLHFISQHNIKTSDKKFVIFTSTGINFFENLCKFKSLRNLIKFLLNEYGLKNEIFIHATNSLINKTAKDVYNNLIRSTIEAMSAIAGGANSISIAPYNFVTEKKDANAQRLAMNQLLILKEEAFLSKVAEVGAGSFYTDEYCNNLSEKAWEKFKFIESEGGLISFFDKGKLQSDINEDASKLKEEFVSGKKILTGVNKFLNLKENPNQRIFPGYRNENGINFESIEEWINESVTNSQ